MILTPARRLWSRGFSWRLFIYTLIPLGFLISISAWTIIAQVENEVEGQMQREVEVVGRALRLPIQRAIVENRQGRIQEALDSIFLIGSVYGAFVYDRNGRLIASVGQGGDDPRFQPYVISVLEGREDTGDYLRFDDSAVYSAFVPVADVFGNPIGLIQVNRRRGEIRTSVDDVRLKILFWSLWLVLGIAAIVLFGHYAAQGRGFRRLLDSISRIQSGNRAHRATPTGPPEIATVARAFNQMLDTLDSAQEEIRERKAMERILREEALRNDRLIELGQIAGGVAHELGSPLTVIRAQLRRLRRAHYPQNLTEKIGDSIDAITAELERTEAVVHQLLDFGRQKSALDEIDVSEVIASAIEVSTTVLGKHQCSVDYHVQGDVAVLAGNRLRLEMAIRNLIVNAAQHAPGTTITIRVTFHAAQVVISISDQGPGIEPGSENKIFQPFISDRPEGHGLGLSIVQKVVREHRGIVRAHSSAQGGAEFRVILPVRR